MVNKKKEKIIIDIHHNTEEEKKEAILALKPLQEITGGVIGYPDVNINIDIGYREITKELIANTCHYLAFNKEHPEKGIANILYGIYFSNCYIYTERDSDFAYKHYVVTSYKDFPPISARVNINYLQDTIIKTDKKTKKKTKGTLYGCFTPIIYSKSYEKECHLYIDDVTEKGQEVFNKLVDKKRILNCSYEEHLKEIKND